ncbi:MAG: glycosyltransferase [Mobilitalea sp.]
MKIWLYKGGIKLVAQSGIGRAYEHQKEALEGKGIAYTEKFSLNYDVVQINTIFPDSFLVAILAKMMGKKVVYYAHSTMEDFKKSFKGSDIVAPLFKKWIKLCYSMGDIIVTPTEYSKELLKSYHINKEIVNLSNGIDLKYYQKDLEAGKAFREKYHFTKEDKIIMSVGHYIERKGVEDFAELARRMPEYQFVWFGYTNLNLIPNRIKQIIQMKLPNLSFPGYITREELKDAYSGSDLFLFLTQEETEGIVLLEALAMKIPSLIRDIPIYEKWLEDRKQVYKGSSLNEFEQSILEIVSGKAPELTEAGYLKVKERNIGMVGDTLYAIYNYLLRKKEENYSFVGNRI